jgi:endonuclease/exonuclease/phosphatase (EEP) superfamily protein YafD
VSWLRRTGTALAQLAVAGFVLVVAGSHVPVWPCTLFEHFAVHYVIGGAAVVAAAGALARRGWLDAALIAWLIELALVTPDLSSSRRELPRGGLPVRLLLLNVLTESTGFDQVRRLIRDERPDVIALVETDHKWLAELAPALAAYPSRIETARGDNFGMALYARTLLTGEVERLGTELPTIVASVELDGVALGVMITHPLPPVSARAVALHDIQFDAVAARARTLAPPLLITGDFNATPWSRAFTRLRERSETCDTRAGFGLQASFPANSWLLRIPIDHVLASCRIGVRDRRIGPDVGSDHLPVILDLVIPR